MSTSKPEHWQALFSLWGIQGIIALCWLVVIPTDTENPLAFGFSSARLILIGIALILIAISVMLWFQNRRSTFRQTWLNLDDRFTFWNLIYIIALFATASAIIFLITIPLFKSNPLYPVYATRITPLALGFGLSAFELSLIIAWDRYGTVKESLRPLQAIWKKTVFLLIIFALLGGFIVITRIGITLDHNWGEPPIPFLEWQIILTLLFCGVLVFSPHILSRENHKWIPFGIYTFTVILWLSQPINLAFTATPPRAPNFEIYPFSDPQFYAEYAQSALIGNGFLWPEVPARPFYVAILTWLHLMGNQSYLKVIVLQTLVLANFPVLLYLVGREIGGIPLGFGLSILAAFRDLNSNIAVPFAGNVTYSKLFLSELPTALLISLATLLSIRWLRSPHRPAWFPFLIGGVLGAATLIRLQSSILVAAIIFVALLFCSSYKQWLKGSIFIVIGFALTITPWLIRNYLAAGGLILDNPISQTMTMARRWSGSAGNELLPRLAGENDAQYSNRLTRLAIESFKRNPGYILHSAGNHFINNEIASLLAFPVRDEILSPSELLAPQHAFWKTPLTISQMPLFAVYLLVFCVGVVAAGHYHGWIGLLPLGLGLIYNMWTALFLSSGERFIVPLDWSMHLYELFGLLILGGVILSFVEGTRGKLSDWLQTLSGSHSTMSEPTVSSRQHFLPSLILVLILGAFLPVTESIFPQKYPSKSQTAIAQHVGMRVENGEVALYGRAIYPRYYDAGEGEPGTAKLGYEPDEKARLVFFLVGPQNGLVIFELKNTPSFFPHASDVYMIGTQMENYYSPRVIKVEKDAQTELYINK